MSSKRTRRVVALGGLVVLILLVVVAVVLASSRGNGSTSATTVSGSANVVEITVKSGMSATQVGQLLQRNGLIKSSGDFVNLVKAKGKENSLHPGSYSLKKGDKLETLVDQLTSGAGAETPKITIAEGLAAGQTAGVLKKSGHIDGAAYRSLVAQPSKFTVPKVGGTTPKVSTLEGLLFPSTYYLVDGETAAQLIETQLSTFQTKTAGLQWSRASALGVTPYEVVIVASLIEKEAKVPEERSLVAAVIYNRLKKNMSLGIDATVRYAVNKWTGSLTSSDLQIDSPYNTRIKKGLPPGPICSPGLAALKAALQPANVDYLYYVLKDANHHFFTSSYEEFVKAKASAPSQ